MHLSQLLLLLLLLNLDRFRKCKKFLRKSKNSKRWNKNCLNTVISTVSETKCGPTSRVAKPSTIQCTKSTRAAETVCAKKNLAVGFNSPPLSLCIVQESSFIVQVEENDCVWVCEWMSVWMSEYVSLWDSTDSHIP